MEFPHYEKFYREYRSQGLEMLALNNYSAALKPAGDKMTLTGDTPELITKYFSHNSITQPVGMSWLADKTSVAAKYTWLAYVVDSNGTIVYRGSTGVSAMPALRAALRKLGFNETTTLD